MREYLMNVIGASLLVGVISILAPEGEGGGLRRYVSFIGALCVLALLISPLGELISYLGGLSEDSFDALTGESEARENYENRYNEYLLSLGKENVAVGVIQLLEERFDIPSDECHVKVSAEERDGELYIENVTVILSGKSLFRNPYEIEKYISELLGCECTVIG
ncbi:MAG: stage III sporulation protein AF [Clostridia bacterium]|nr:stage III sporulation protein AF [Clostridia bacterium]